MALTPADDDRADVHEIGYGHGDPGAAVIRVPPRWLPEAGLTTVTFGAGATPVPVTGMEMFPKSLCEAMCAVIAASRVGW